MPGEKNESFAEAADAAQLAKEAAQAASLRGEKTEADLEIERAQKLDAAHAKIADAEKAKQKVEQKPAEQKVEEKKEEPQEGEAEATLYEAPTAEDRQWALDNYGPGVATAMDKAGINAPAANDYWQEHGKLPESALKKLEDAGYPRAMVNTYLDGVRSAGAKAAEDGKALAKELAGLAGGSANYKRMTEWAAGGGMTAAELQDYNALIASKDASGLRMGVRALRARFEQANGRLPRVQVTGKMARSEASTEREPEGGGDVFRSSQEIIAAQRDPRYQRDAAYRREVEQKVVRSNLHGKARRPAPAR